MRAKPPHRRVFMQQRQCGPRRPTRSGYSCNDAAVRGDAPADLGAARTGRLTADGVTRPWATTGRNVEEVSKKRPRTTAVCSARPSRTAR